MQRDVEAGRPSEVAGLTYEVPKMAEKAGVQAPAYEEIGELLRGRGL